MLALLLGVAGLPAGAARAQSAEAPVTVRQDAETFTLANGAVTARIDKRTGTVFSLVYQGVELLAAGRRGGDGAYWSSVGRGKAGSRRSAAVLIDPAATGGARAEVSCRQFNNPAAPDGGIDADYRYSLGRGEHWLYASAVLSHRAGYPAYGVGEARYCLKLNPAVFDYMTVDADRRREMPSGYDWDHGITMNLKEARRMTTGVHKGEVEHKYDYSAVLAETPAYGWSSTERHVGLWLVNPSMEYLGGGPTKFELTGHLDVNPGGLPTLLNMWVGSHYGGTSLGVAPGEPWTKTVGPFLLYCNSADSHEAMWRDALARAATETAEWPYAWAADKDYPSAAERGTVSGRLVLQDPFDPGVRMSNVWVGVTAPDYVMGRPNSGTAAPGNYANRAPRGGMPPVVDWQRDAKHYEFWTRADAQGRFAIPHVRAGSYTLHAIAAGVLGEFTRTNVTVGTGESLGLGEIPWVPMRYGRTVWEIGVPDRTAREFRHGDHYWQWGLYFDYPQEFPKDVDFTIGKSDWHKDWNYVQPPRIVDRNVGVSGEDEEQREDAAVAAVRSRGTTVQPTTWTVRFQMPGPADGRAVLRLAFCGTHQGTHVEVLVNGQTVGATGELPPESAMQRDGIGGYWIEKDIAFDARLFKSGENTVRLYSHANSWSQGVMYDYVRLEQTP